MKIFLKKKVLLPIISVSAFVLSLVWAFVSTPNVYADTSYTYSVSDINFKTASTDGYFTISKANGMHDGKTGKISYSMSANSSLSFTFAPTNKIITSVSSFNFYGEYDIDDYGTMAAKSVTYSYNFGSYTSTSTTTTSEYTFSVDQDQLNAQKPGSITFTITANEILQLRVGGSFVFNAKDANVDVNFNAQGGSGGTSTIKATPGSAMPSITLPTKTGYSFDGYYTGTNGGGTKYYNANGSSANNCPSTGLTLYAKWTANTYTVTLDRQSGSGGSSSVTATYNSAMPSMTKPTRTGYTFGGYYTGTNGEGTQYYNANGESAKNWDKTSNTTLYAKWTANTYTVTLDKQEGTGGSNSVTATYDSAMPTMTKPTRTGYTFGGYYTGTNGEGTQYYNANGESAKNWDKTSATTLYAKWTLLPVIQDVIDKIDTIGTVTYPNSKSLINTARDAYDALDDSYKNLVSNYETLTTAETTYDNLKNTAVNNVKDLIDAIGEVKYPDSKNDIIAAEEAYANLDNDEKNVTTITNYETLTDARTEYDAQRNTAVQAVIAAINAIGEVKYPDSKNDITLARDLYDALDEDEQNIATITNYETLTTAETTYANLRDAAIADVYDKIDVINVPLFYPNSNTELTTARTAFDKLDTDDKNDTIITNYQDLLDLEAVYSIVVEINEFGTPNVTQAFRDKVSNARNEYEELNSVQQSLFPDKELHILYNYETALVVMDIIQNIGLISYTTESKSKMDNAKESYDNLTNEQKELVTNYQVLTHDIEVYNHVDDVYKKINDINEVKYEETSEEEINVARRSYDDLTDEEKALVVNYEKLTTDETTYKELRNDHITFVGWMIALAIMGGIILSLFIAYILFFFVFNKWTLANNKAIRVFKIGKKNDKIRLLTITLMVIYRNEDKVFNRKSDVIK